MDKKRFSESEVSFILNSVSSNVPIKAIADSLGRSPRVIRQKIDSLKKKGVVAHKSPFASILSKIPPREIIKFLYDLGYRIKENKLVLLQEQIIDINDIVNENS